MENDTPYIPHEICYIYRCGLRYSYSIMEVNKENEYLSVKWTELAEALKARADAVCVIPLFLGTFSDTFELSAGYALLFRYEMNGGLVELELFHKDQSVFGFNSQISSSLDWPDFFRRAMDIVNEAYALDIYRTQAVETVVEAAHKLQEAGYHIQIIQTPSDCYPAYMVDVAGETILLNSRFYQGRELFIEIKRPYPNADPFPIQKALLEKGKAFRGIGAYAWKDGSISYRLLLDEETPGEQFAEAFLEKVDLLKRGVAYVEKRKHLIDRYFPEETFFRDLDTKELFIHQVKETCLQLSMMNL